MMALCVDPARINEVWPHVSQFIKSACEYGLGEAAGCGVGGGDAGRVPLRGLRGEV